MKLIFAGTPDVAVPSLLALNAEHEILAVLTRPDAPSGRKRELTPSPVKTAALELGLLVVHSPQELAELGLIASPNSADAPLDAPATDVAQMGVVVAYGEILRPAVLEALPLGWVNLHFSLLPEYRGAAPVQRAILEGKSETGISVFRLQEGLDDGPVVFQQPYSIPESATSSQVLSELSVCGAQALVQTAREIESGTALFNPQPPQGATTAAKLLKTEARINWQLPAEQIAAHINAFSSNPGAWFELLQSGKPPQRIVALQAKAAAGKLELLRVKPAGKPEMPAEAWQRGLRGEFEFA